MAAQSITPTEKAWFTGQKNRLSRSYFLGKQQNEYERSVSNNQYTWDRGDLLKKLGDARTKIPGQYNRSGLQNSGMAQRGLIDFNRERYQATARLGQANALKTRGFDLTQSQLSKVRTESTTDLNRQITALRQLRAEALQGVL